MLDLLDFMGGPALTVKTLACEYYLSKKANSSIVCVTNALCQKDKDLLANIVKALGYNPKLTKIQDLPVCDSIFINFGVKNYRGSQILLPELSSMHDNNDLKKIVWQQLKEYFKLTS